MFTIMQGGVHSTREIMRSYAGIIRIRFIGYDLSPGGHPCKYLFSFYKSYLVKFRPVLAG